MTNDSEISQPSISGLTSEQVILSRKQFGRNELGRTSSVAGILDILKFFKDPMGIMILSLALIYFMLGEKQDAIIMLFAFIPISFTDVFLEIKGEKAIKALKATFQPTAKVLRNNILTEIPIQDIVVNDCVILEEGQTAPADGIILTCANLSVSEASLTGESIPIDKLANEEIYAGTTILSGRGVYQVNQIGKNTKFGKIIELLQITDEGASPLQEKIHKMVIQILKVAGLLVVCLFFLEWMRGKSLLQSLLISLTFGMSAVPEEFPLVFTLYLNLGAWRLSKNGVLVKSLPSVETLGSVNVICTDKTGTLTEGKFQLVELVSFTNLTIPEQWLYTRLACEPIIVDSMEIAIKDKIPKDLDISDWKLIHDYEFEVEGKHMSHAWSNLQNESIVSMKGAIEGVLEHCADSLEIKNIIIEKANDLSRQGYRLLGLAGKNSKITGSRDLDEKGLSFIGILAFQDPIRESAKKAIEICQQEGISVKMITGDHPYTAHAIADQLGLEHNHDALYIGADLKEMNDAQRTEAYRRGAIFSRMSPDQKFELLKSLKSDGKIVAMTGDGVNDTPAMKVADIGISMGDNATDAARATAKMVLTKSDFYGIVYAIKEGRRIFSNLKKSFSYLIAFHVPVVLLSFFPSLLNLGELLLPIHIILLELVVHPVSAFTFENLKNESSHINTNIIDKKMAYTSMLSGCLVSLFAILLFVDNDQLKFEERRSLAMATLLFGNIGYVIQETWPKFSYRLLVTIILLILITFILLYLPSFSIYLKLSPIPMKMLILCFVLGVTASLPAMIINNKKF